MGLTIFTPKGLHNPAGGRVLAHPRLATRALRRGCAGTRPPARDTGTPPGVRGYATPGSRHGHSAGGARVRDPRLATRALRRGCAGTRPPAGLCNPFGVKIIQ